MTTLSVERVLSSQPGNLVDITGSDWKADPFPFYAQLRQHKPVLRVRMGRMEGWLITRYDDVVSVLRDPRFVKDVRKIAAAAELSRRPWVPSFLHALEQNMLDQDAPNHTRLRTLVHKAFTPTRIEQLRTHIRSLSEGILHGLERTPKFDLVADFALPLPLTVICELLGIPEQERSLFQRLSQQALLPPTTLNMVRLMPAMWRLIRYIRRLLALRKQSPQDDLLTALSHAEEAGDTLSEDEQVAMVMLLLIAGHETTVNLISSGMLALLDHPEQLAWLRAHPEGMKTAVEELLRYCNPVETATERYAAEAMTIQGQSIRQGELVIASLASANRDETHFPNPEVLDLKREPNRHLAFGQGSHFCLGAPLARMEAQIGLGVLIERFAALRLAVPRDKLRWRNTPVVRGLKVLPLTR